MPFAATQMDPEIIILSEVIQIKKDKNYVRITYIMNLINNTNKSI